MSALQSVALRRPVRLSYNDLTLRYFKEARMAGQLAGEGIARGCAGSSSECWVRFDLDCDAAKIRAARFLAFGCPHTIAVSSGVAEAAAGRKLSESLPESVEVLLQRFDVPREKMSRLFIIEDAWIAAIRDAVTKSGNLAD